MLAAFLAWLHVEKLPGAFGAHCGLGSLCPGLGVGRHLCRGPWLLCRGGRRSLHTGIIPADPVLNFTLELLKLSAAVRRVALVPAALRLWLYVSMSPVKEGPALGSPGVSASTFVNICQPLPRVNAALIGSYRQRVSIVAWVPSAYKKNGLLWPLVFPGSGSILWAAPPLSSPGGVRHYSILYSILTRFQFFRKKSPIF